MYVKSARLFYFMPYHQSCGTGPAGAPEVGILQGGGTGAQNKIYEPELSLKFRSRSCTYGYLSGRSRSGSLPRY